MRLCRVSLHIRRMKKSLHGLCREVIAQGHAVERQMPLVWLPWIKWHGKRWSTVIFIHSTPPIDLPISAAARVMASRMHAS